MHNLNGHKEEFKSSEEDLKESIITPKKLQIKFLTVHAPIKGIHKLKGVCARRTAKTFCLTFFIGPVGSETSPVHCS